MKSSFGRMGVPKKQVISYGGCMNLQMRGKVGRKLQNICGLFSYSVSKSSSEKKSSGFLSCMWMDPETL